MILLTNLADLSLKLKQGYDNIISRHSDSFFSSTLIAESGMRLPRAVRHEREQLSAPL
jgi:hypothetical protein